MAAQVKEVVGAAHVAQAQHLAPQAGNDVFKLALRRSALRGHTGCARVGQRCAVHLAVGRERKVAQQHQAGGHHDLGQVRGQRRLQGLRLQHHALMRRHIANQTVTAGLVSTGHHHSLPHAGQALQLAFNFAQLNAVAANLHLVVGAAQKLQRTVRVATHQVTGAVPTCPRPRGLRHKAFSGQLRPAQVTGRHAVTANPQLAGHQRGAFQPRGIAHAQPGVGNRLTEGHKRIQIALRVCLECAGGGPHGGLGRAVHVEHLAGHQRAQLAGQRQRQRFTAHHQHRQATQRAASRLVGHQHGRHRRRALQMRHSMARDVVSHPGTRRDRTRRLGAVHHLLEQRQVRQHLLRRHTKIHQATDFIDTDALQLLHQGQAALRCAKQRTGVVIARKRMLEQRVHVLV